MHEERGQQNRERDASARGAFVGLSLAHSRAHLTRAVVEGVCFALRDSVSILHDLGLSPDHMLLTGGGAKSPFVRRLQSEVFGLPVCTVNREEGPAYGAALLDYCESDVAALTPYYQDLIAEYFPGPIRW